jgi:tripartite-type tricarboxylate transporter receptor subunit TctC
MKRSLIALAVAVPLVLAGCASKTDNAAPSEGAAFPVKGGTIQIIVPSAAGAGNDILARIIAPALQEKLGANVEVINKEGGGQIIGLSYLAEAKGDGMTIGFTNIPSILGRYLDPTKNAKFKRDSFAPVGSFTTNTVGVFVQKNSEFKTFADLVANAKANPGALTTGTDSRAGDDHINLLKLEKAVDSKFNIVHYNSGADKVAALVAGEVKFAIGGVSSFYGQVKAGDLRALTVVSDTESQFLPGVPTLKSAGFTADDMTSRFALSAPASTPASTVSKLEAALKAVVEDPAIAKKLTDAATEPKFLSAADMAKLWADREATTKPIIESLLTAK